MGLNWLPPIEKRLRELCLNWQLPLGLIIGWIESESSGDYAEKPTKYGERGYFQLMPSESAQLKIDHVRLSTDQDYSLSAGIEIVDLNHTYALKITNGIRALSDVSNRSDYIWRLTKFCHSIGPGAARQCVEAAAMNSSADNWDELSVYCLKNEVRLYALTHHSPGKWIAKVNSVWQIGEPYGMSIPVDPWPTLV